MPFDGIDPSDADDANVTSPSEWRKRAARALRSTPLKQLRGNWGQPYHVSNPTGCALAVLSHAKLLPQDDKEGTSARNFEARFGIGPDLLMRLNDHEFYTFSQIANFLEHYDERISSHPNHRPAVYLWEPMDPLNPPL